MYHSIALSFGPDGYDGERVILKDIAPILLVVGPNGAGKSRFLRELKQSKPRTVENLGPKVESLELSRDFRGRWVGSEDKGKPAIQGVSFRLPSTQTGRRVAAAMTLLSMVPDEKFRGVASWLLQQRRGEDILKAAEETLGPDPTVNELLSFLLEALDMGPGSGIYEIVMDLTKSEGRELSPDAHIDEWVRAILIGEKAKECIERAGESWIAAVDDLLKRVPHLTGRERLGFQPVGEFSRVDQSNDFRKRWPRMLVDDPDLLMKLGELLRPIIKDGYLGVRLTEGASRAELVLCDGDPRPHQQSLSAEAWDFFQQARSIEELSDGQRSWLSMMFRLSLEDLDAALIDEPEAFLHPPLCRELGCSLAIQAKDSGATYVVATHSADIVLGCARAGVEVDILRLSYDGKTPRANLLRKDRVLEMVRNPHLRSSEVLSAIFHQRVIVVEGGSDRAFYGEINQRLLRAKDPRAISDCLFLNANGKQNARKILKMCRELGVNAAVIVDFDVLLDKGDLASLLVAVGASESARDGLNARLSKVKDLLGFAGNQKDEVLRRVGVKAIDDNSVRGQVLELCDQLEAYGIFVLTHGALESWLLKLERGKHSSRKDKWLRATFEAMGTEGEDGYVSPSDGDVWGFMGKVSQYLA